MYKQFQAVKVNDDVPHWGGRIYGVACDQTHPKYVDLLIHANETDPDFCILSFKVDEVAPAALITSEDKGE